MSDERTYPVMFTPPATDERGTPEGADLIRAILAEEVQSDGYSYASFGPVTRANLERIASDLDAFSARGWIEVTPQTMPKAGDFVLVIFPHGKHRWILRAMWLSPELAAEPQWETEDGDPSRPGWYEVAWNADEMWDLSPAPTHWQPLPLPPA